MPSRLIAPAPAASQGHLPSQAKMPGHITVTLESSMAPASIPVATISGQQVGPTHLGLSSSAKFLYSLSWKWRWWRTALFSLSCRDKVTCTTWWQPTCRLSGAAHLHCRSALLPLPLTLSHPTCPEVSSNIVAAQMHCCTSVWTCIKYDTLGGSVSLTWVKKHILQEVESAVVIATVNLDFQVQLLQLWCRAVKVLLFWDPRVEQMQLQVNLQLYSTSSISPFRYTSCANILLSAVSIHSLSTVKY